MLQLGRPLRVHDLDLGQFGRFLADKRCAPAGLINVLFKIVERVEHHHAPTALHAGTDDAATERRGPGGLHLPPAVSEVRSLLHFHADLRVIGRTLL